MHTRAHTPGTVVVLALGGAKATTTKPTAKSASRRLCAAKPTAAKSASRRLHSAKAAAAKSATKPTSSRLSSKRLCNCCGTRESEGPALARCACGLAPRAWR